MAIKKSSKKNKLTRGQVRNLLFVQKGRCAISGFKLDPKNVSIDHIVPLSRKEFKDNPLYGKIWLVDTRVNKLKGNLTIDELNKIIEGISKNMSVTDKLKKSLSTDIVEEMNVDDFNKYIEENFDDDGFIKK
tara:strand:+ start:776 stop:1171 length:396 start_codon:yes stop_codon:yes gene_type:complete